MPQAQRFKTKYPSVYYIEGTDVATGKPERIYYIRYRKDGKTIEEKAGRQFQDDMTPSKAASARVRRIHGDEPSNEERREAERVAKLAEQSRWTINKLWEEYKAQKGDYPTLRTDKSNYNHIKIHFADKEPAELLQFDIDRLRIKLSKKLKPQTVKHVLRLLNRLINFGVKKGLCTGLGFKIQMPTVHNIKTEDLSSEQLQKLIKAIEEDEDIQAANMMRLALFTGMRRGELFNLRWEDLDFERGFIHLRDPKGGPDQKIPLNAAARGVLQSHPKIKGSSYVFPGRSGSQRREVRVSVNRIRTRAQLPKDFRPFHGLRHVYASMLASSGQVDIYTLQKLLTHKSPVMTQRYAHLRDEALRRASELAGDLIDEAVNGKDKDSAVEEESA